MIDWLAIQWRSCWEKSYLGINMLGLRILKMNRELDDLTGWMVVFNFLDEQFKRFPAIPLALMAGINEKVEHPLLASVFFAILIGQGHKPDHLLLPVNGIG